MGVVRLVIRLLSDLDKDGTRSRHIICLDELSSVASHTRDE